MLACCEDILKEKSYLARYQCDFFSSPLQVLVPCHLYCWALRMIIQVTRLQFKRKCLLKFSFVCQISYFLYFSMNMKISIFVVKTDCLEQPSPLYHCVCGKVYSDLRRLD